VMAAIESACTDIEPLLVGDFFRANQFRRVAGARRGDSGIVGMRKRISQGYARRSGLHEFPRTRPFKHARLISHDGRLFYTDGQQHAHEHTSTVSKKADHRHVCGSEKRLLLRGSGLGSGIGVFLRESLDAPGGVNKLLFASEKGMAARANFHP
jgi:hypothetical protein